jgi:outer membrane lipoprotein-sorting protein
MTPDKPDNRDQALDRVVRAMKRMPVPDGPPADVLADLVATGVRGRPVPRRMRLWERIQTMNWLQRTAAVGAAAAVVVAAALAAFFLWPGNGAHSLAIADMIAPITAKTARFVTSVRMDPAPDGAPAEHRCEAFWKAPGRMRQNLVNGTYQVLDFQESRSVTFIPEQKMAFVLKMTGMPTPDQPMTGDLFSDLRRRIDELREADDERIERLGEKVIDGGLARGFRMGLEGYTMTVWADTQTRLPVRVEMAYGKSPRYEVTISDFEFDVLLDPDLFSMAIPEGYTVQERSMDLSPTKEAEFAAGLGLWAEVLGGTFPDRLDMDHGMKVMRELVKQMDGQGQQMPSQKQMDRTFKVNRVLMFVLQLSAEQIDWRYAGKGVTRGQAEAPIFWYRPAGAADYRVIYGDLSVRDVAPEDVPEAPDAQRPEVPPAPPAQPVPGP